MVNKGSPAWSDKYRCAEWPWLNGVVDVMAFGNHDPDYGPDDFARCRGLVRYPILSANTAGFRKTAVLRAKGIRVGVFALAGDDFASLTKGFTYSDRTTAAREAVRELRRTADVVVMIGHETTQEDYALARAVPGIDVIFGTHSHFKQELRQIEGTGTWFISPYQYLTYISRVELTFEGKKLRGVDGRLVRVDKALKAAPTVSARVANMERELERDPQYAPLFAPVARLHSPVSVDELGENAVALMQAAGAADVALSTRSSFRQPLPPGALTMEALRAALPYDNEIVVGSMKGNVLRGLLEFSRSQGAGDIASYVSPLPDIDDAKSYRVATTDYLARVSPYKQFFTAELETTGRHGREEVRKWLTK
jgi:5'-nucleotidase